MTGRFCLRIQENKDLVHYSNYRNLKVDKNYHRDWKYSSNRKSQKSTKGLMAYLTALSCVGFSCCVSLATSTPARFLTSGLSNTLHFGHLALSKAFFRRGLEPGSPKQAVVFNFNDMTASRDMV